MVEIIVERFVGGLFGWFLGLLCNFGKEVVLLVGLEVVYGDIVVIIDVDF